MNAKMKASVNNAKDYVASLGTPSQVSVQKYNGTAYGSHGSYYFTGFQVVTTIEIEGHQHRTPVMKANTEKEANQLAELLRQSLAI